MLAIPLHRFTTPDPALVAGKLAVDVMNYWLAVDGVVRMFEGRQPGSSDGTQVIPRVRQLLASGADSRLTNRRASRRRVRGRIR